MRWRKDRIVILIPRFNTIIPSCLKVESAIIFFKSISAFAFYLDIRDVCRPKISIKNFIFSDII